MVERIQSPWIQPCGRRDHDEDPHRLVALPFACAVAFFARSKVAVLSFTIVADEAGMSKIGKIIVDMDNNNIMKNSDAPAEEPPILHTKNPYW